MTFLLLKRLTQSGDDWVLADEHLGDMLSLIPEMRMFVDLLRANIQSPEAYQRELELQ